LIKHNQYYYPVIASIGLIFVLFLSQAFDYSVLIILFLLFFPLLDRQWFMGYQFNVSNQIPVLVLCVLIMGLLFLLRPEYHVYMVSTLFFAALPEEWFFRAYLMQRINQLFCGQIYANIISSILFALLHVPTQGWFGLAVFFPSFIFGWLFQKTANLMLVIMIHSLCNIIYMLYLSSNMKIFTSFISN